MSDRRFEPEEFERLLGLPEGDPKRARAEQSSRLPAWKHMLKAFESPPDQLMTPRELAEAEAEVERRVEQALARGPASEPARPRPMASWLRGWTTGGRRVALAVASVAIVAVAGWWSIERMRVVPAVRSAGGEKLVELSASPVSGGIELRWRAVADGRMYRLVFYDSDLTERARIDSLRETRFTLRADRLPAGLSSGQSVLVEVTAVRRYDEITSRAITIVVP